MALGEKPFLPFPASGGCWHFSEIPVKLKNDFFEEQHFLTISSHLCVYARNSLNLDHLILLLVENASKHKMIPTKAEVSKGKVVSCRGGSERGYQESV